ncbi:hypothetical protein [Anaerobaca lacustris]|uniref:Uncharacterized protein n=1 Tax=Anaerobaca lacustris TaxID=3044600 RepID=A0AAW6U088_9BACT|nr:hypothetical protein [Sedimentisphaerales bacterium M17dextr]
MADFEEICLSGGRFEFKWDAQGVSPTYSNLNPFRCTIFQVCVSWEGRLLDYVPIGGMGSVGPYPQPSILVLVVSDRQGMFGRTCPKCKCYFRVDTPTRLMFCPYCRTRANNVHFTTENQKRFVGLYCSAVVSALKEERDTVIELDKWLDALPENRPKWAYREETQQTIYKCSKCKCAFDICGDYGSCPICGERNSREVIGKKLDDIEKRLCASKLSDGEIGDTLVRCVGEFEAMADDIKQLLLTLPATLRRKKELEGLRFQNIERADERLQAWYGFELLGGISSTNREFLTMMFQRRHIFAHNAGRVDSQYIERSGDRTVRLNQIIRLRPDELNRFIGLLRQCSYNLIDGCASIS